MRFVGLGCSGLCWLLPGWQRLFAALGFGLVAVFWLCLGLLDFMRLLFWLLAAFGGVFRCFLFLFFGLFFGAWLFRGLCCFGVFGFRPVLLLLPVSAAPAVSAVPAFGAAGAVSVCRPVLRFGLVGGVRLICSVLATMGGPFTGA